MSENIFNIVSSYQYLLDAIMEQEGEVTEEQYEQLLANEVDRDEKLDYICYRIDDREARIAAIEKEQGRLDALIGSHKKDIERSKKLLMQILTVYNLRNKAGSLSHKTSLHTVFTRTTESILLDPTSLMHYDPVLGTKTSKYVTYKVTDEYSKDEILKLKDTPEHKTLTYSLVVDKKAIKPIIKSSLVNQPIENVVDASEPSLFAEVVEVEPVEVIDFATIQSNTGIYVH